MALLYCIYFYPDSFQKGYETDGVMKTVRWGMGISGEQGREETGEELKRPERAEEWGKGHGWGNNPIPL